MILIADGVDNSWSGVVRAVVFGFGMLVLLTVLTTALLRAWVETRKARIAAGNEQQLRDVVHRYEQLATGGIDAQQRTATELAELRARVDAIEQVLRSVE